MGTVCRRRGIALVCLLAICAALTGCNALLEREYSTVEEHNSKYFESESSDTLRAETYQDVVNDLLILIGRHTEAATLRLYNYTDDASAADTLDRAASEVQLETPMGAYAVEYITSESQNQRSYYEAELRIRYRRTAEQIQSIVNATSANALPDLLDTALDAGKTELTVRIGYWGDLSAERVAQVVEDVRARRGLTDLTPWTVSFYPETGPVGLIEFVLVSSDDLPVPDAARATDAPVLTAQTR